jgi:4-cresol dehydrogenase (hydroxylating)
MNSTAAFGAQAALLSRWRQLLGEGFFEPGLDETLPDVGEFRRRRVRAMLRPRTQDQVCAVVTLAAEFAGIIPLYPVSTGRNWGLGSRQPVTHDCAVLDLGRLDRVREVKRERGYAIVEPGVTQQELSRLLEGSPWMVNVTGSCADSSILGNALERGVGFTRQRTEDLLALEVVLASGEQVRVGSYWGAPGSAPSSFHYRHGVGPDLLPLFCQSNLGIVTAGVVALLPRPECLRVFQATIPETMLDQALEGLRKLHRDGLLNNVSKVYNATAMRAYGLGSGAGGFLFSGAYSGRRQIADAVAQAVLAELRGFARSEDVLAFDAENAGNTPGADLSLAGSFAGRPGACRSIRTMFGARGCDVDRSGAEGWLMFLPVVPFEPAALRRALSLSEAIAGREGLQRNATLNLLGPNGVDLVVSLRFPRTAEGIRRGHSALDQLHRAFREEGFFPYRADVDHQHADDLYGTGPYRDTLRELKRALDPQGIIAPGRYLPGP